MTLTGDGERASIRRRRGDGHSRADGVAPQPHNLLLEQAQPIHELPTLVWGYRWEDSLNGTHGESADPLHVRIVEAIIQVNRSGTGAPLMAIRGELGSGKSELRDLLSVALDQAADAIRATEPRVADQLIMCRVIEAADLQSGNEFAHQIAEAVSGAPVVALARPSTWEVALSALSRNEPSISPSVTASILPFRDSTPGVFGPCITRVIQLNGLSPTQAAALRHKVSELPDFLATPFYFSLIARAMASDAGNRVATLSVLNYFSIALQDGIGGADHDDLLAIALDQAPSAAGRRVIVQGIVENAAFRHDGYRNLVLALAASEGRLSIERLGAASNAVPAFRVLLEHLRSGTSPDLVHKIAAFVEYPVNQAAVQYPLYLQAIAAAVLDEVGDSGSGHRDLIRERCLQLIADREGFAGGGPESELLERYSGAELAWDISDAMEVVGDPRLDDHRLEERFTRIATLAVKIGTNEEHPRKDDAKPVLSYSLQSVELGPVWVNDFLVTNADFDEFWKDSPEDYYIGAGERWVQGDATLLAEIEKSFDAVAPRCFWKELEVESASKYSTLPSALKVARSRALRQDEGMLRDRDSMVDERFSAPGKPIVGVTWWDAMAYCLWFEENVLKRMNAPGAAEVSLLSDWEWEAIRREFFDVRSDRIARQAIRDRSFPAHVKTVRSPRGGKAAMRLFQPVQVGIFPRPTASGPYDLVGNVWEWTRSRVFGKITRNPDSTPNDPFGGTYWDDVDAVAERIAVTPGRDTLQPGDPLAYRAVRGSSWFSSDEEAAWDPAYRLCDPPYSSYWDLGFRIAIYPEGLPNEH